MKAFSAVTILLLFVELFAPLAYAQTPTPTPTPTPSPTATPSPTTTPSASPTPTPAPRIRTSGLPTCDINAMTDQERQTLWNYLFSKDKPPFQADWLNDLSNAEAAANPQVPGNPLERRGERPEEKYTLPLKDIAAAAGKTEEQAAKEIGIWDYQKGKVKDQYMVGGVAHVTAKQALDFLPKYAQERSKAEDLFEDIQKQLKSLVSGKEREKEEKERAAELKPYERYRITLPGQGKQMSLADFFSLREIDPNSCLLKNELVKGRVSYAAILDADLTYGTDNAQIYSGDYVSPATGKPNPDLQSSRKVSLEDLSESTKASLPTEAKEAGKIDVNQFMAANRVIGYMALNEGSNIVVPEFYRDWIVFAYQWTKWDLYVSGALAVASLGGARGIQEAKAAKEKASERITRLREGSPLSKLDINERLYGKIDKDNFGRLRLEKDVQMAPGQGWHGAPGGNAHRVSIETDPGGNQGLVYFDAAGNPTGSVPGIRSMDDAVQAKSLNFRRAEKGIEDQIVQGDANQRAFEAIKGALVRRVTASYMIAGGWLGPARLFYSLNEGALFEARHSQDDKYLRLLVDKQPALADFKRASGILAIGRVQETIARFIGAGFTPEKAFFPGKQMILNYPTRGATVTSSFTGFKGVGNDYAVSSKWEGDSYAVNYEDLRNVPTKDAYTAVDVVSNNILPKPVLEGRNLKALTAFFALAIPYLASRRIFDLGERALGTVVFLTTLEFLDVPEDLGKDMECERKELAEFKDKFRKAFAVSAGTTLFSILTPLWFTKSTGFVAQVFTSLPRVLDWTNPGDLWKWYIGDAAITYTSNCKDSMHTILSYQKIPDRVKASPPPSAVEGKVPFLEQLSLPRILAASDEEKKYIEYVKKLAEVLNLRTQLTKQKGFFYTQELLYVHFTESEFSQKWGLFDLINEACERGEGLQSKDGRRITLHEGVIGYNDDGSVAFSFKSLEWKLRGLARNRNQAIARTIIPNKLISSTLSGGKEVFLNILGTGQSTLVNPPCDLRGAIMEITGRDIGTDFTQAIGKVASIVTDAGEVGFQDGRVYFINPLGKTLTAPTPEDLKKAVTEGTKVELLNDGEVVIHGPPGGEVKKQSAGTFKTILGDNGRVEYDAASKKIYVIIYSIFETSAQNFAGYSIAPRGKGVQIEAKPKPGQEASAEKLNKALDKIAGKEGITMFETKDRIYYLTPDGKLRIIDKKTGEVKEYNVTGPPRKEGNQVVIPTDKGDFKFSIDNIDGRPTLNAEGPDLKELLPLLVARGQNGILTFNPSTGSINVYNGQDIPMNPDFTKGIGLSGTSTGSTQGIPASNPFEKTITDTSALGTAPRLFLPSWPTELFALLAMMLALFGAVVAVRFRKEPCD